jgi:hypothetical protein
MLLLQLLLLLRANDKSLLGHNVPL